MGSLCKQIRRRAVAVALGLLIARGVAGAASEWPRSLVARNGATVTIHQPQIAEWPNQSAVTFYSAVGYRPANGAAAVGTVAVEADTTVSFAKRRVHFSRFAVVDASFPTLKPGDVAEIVAAIEKMLPPEGRTMALDEVLAAVNARPLTPRNVAGLKADPPTIFVSNRPAVVVNIDGTPVWQAIAGGTLQYAINTNWDLFRDPKTGTYYLRCDREWLTASNVLGPWTRATRLAAGFDHLPSARRWDAARAAIPLLDASIAKTPVVFVSRQPAELIAFGGPPVYQRVPGTSRLQWVSNTDSDVFREGTTGPVYYLVAGRWFTAPDFTGPWTFATRPLPADLAKIPLRHPRSHVLASVPGTPQAAEAVLLAQARLSARVDKSLAAPDVRYDGAPAFALIPGTPIARAINTDKDVLKAGALYYLCADAVWFSANTPAGPWKVTGQIPSAIYQIPPSSPAYRVTRVIVEDDRDDSTTFATTAAYNGTFVAGDTVVWGTGMNSHSYVSRSQSEPMYVPAPATYGMGAWYNPWTASFGRARSGYGPTLPTASRMSVFESWDARLVQRTDHPTTARTVPEAVGTSGVLSTAPPAARAEVLYAGRNGIVYRKRAGIWEKNANGAWVPARASLNETPILRQLDTDARARLDAAERSRVAATLQSVWGLPAASYRPSTIAGRVGQ